MSDYGLKQMELLDLRAASQHQGDVNSNNNNKDDKDERKAVQHVSRRWPVSMQLARQAFVLSSGL